MAASPIEEIHVRARGDRADIFVSGGHQNRLEKSVIEADASAVLSFHRGLAEAKESQRTTSREGSLMGAVASKEDHPSRLTKILP